MRYAKKRTHRKVGYTFMPPLKEFKKLESPVIGLEVEKAIDIMGALTGKLDISLPEPKSLPKHMLRPTKHDMLMIDHFMSETTHTDQLFDLVDYKALDEVKPYDNDHDYIKRWYRDEVPNINSKSFARFIVSSKELARFVSNNYDLVIELVPGNTAYADPEKNAIVLPAEAFDLSSYGDSVFADDEKATRRAMASIANGMLVHEAAHFAKSPKLLTDGIKFGQDRMRGNGETAINDTNIARLFLNMVEDIYIEDWLAEEFASYKPFLSTTHEFYFCMNELKRRIMGCVHPPLPPEDRAKFNGGAVLDLLVASKNWKYIDEKFWGPKLTKYMEMLRSIRKQEDKAIRGEIALKLSKMFLEDEDFSKDYNERIGVMIILDKDGKGVAVEFKVSDPELGKPEDRLVVTRITSIKREIEDDKVHERRKEDSEFGHIYPIILKDPPYSRVDFALDPRFEALGQRLRRSLTNNYVPGPAMKRGPVMVNTRLTRIATDGKIFSYREKRKAEGKDYEFVILVDCSGSMRSGDKITEAMIAGYTAYTSLRLARCRVVLFGHSEDSSGRGQVPVLYTIGNSNDPFHDVKSKAAAFIDRGMVGLLRNNYDGFAIKKAAEIGYSMKPSKKFMFVISDGEPAGDNYHGDLAIAHTRRCVEDARKSGIDIISITIEHGAVHVNNEIYGKEKNVATTSPLVLNELISAMLTRTIR